VGSALDINDINTLVGLVFVTLFAYSRFHTPRLNREATTPSRYLGVLLSYLVLNGLLYWVLATLLLKVGPGVFKLFIGEIGGDSASKLPPSLLSALLMTVLLPRLPGLGTIDEQIRDWFQRLASVSQVAANLSNLLQFGTLNIGAKTRDEVGATLQQQGLKAADIRFDDDGSPQYIWTKTSVLAHRSRGWRTEPGYDRFVTSYAGEHKALLDEYEQLSDNANHCFRLADVGRDDPVLAEALKDCRNHHAEQLKRYLTKLCDFMSRGIVQCHHTPEARREAVIALGFEGEFCIGFTIHQIAFVFVTLLGIFFAGIIFAGHIASASGFSVVLLPLQTATSYTVAVLCAITVRNRYRRTHRDVAQRPWAMYIGTALLAAVAGSAISILFGAMRPDWELVDSFEQFQNYRWTFQLLPLAMAFTTAYLIDARLGNFARTRLRLLEGALLAVVMAIAAILAAHLLGELNPERWGWSHMDSENFFKVVRFFIISTTLGFFIGYWVPTACRESTEPNPNAAPMPTVGQPSAR
jgi:hypothetical protein